MVFEPSLVTPMGPETQDFLPFLWWVCLIILKKNSCNFNQLKAAFRHLSSKKTESRGGYHTRHLEAPWGILRSSWRYLEVYWSRLGCLGAILGHLGAILGHLGCILEGLGDVLGPLGGDLEASWVALGRSWRHLKNLSGAFGGSWEGLGSILEPWLKHVSSFTKIFKNH